MSDKTSDKTVLKLSSKTGGVEKEKELIYLKGNRRTVPISDEAYAPTQGIRDSKY